MKENTKSENVEWKALGEIGEIYGGISGKKKEDFKNGNKKLITYKNVYENLSLNLNVEDKVRIEENEKQRKLEYGDIIFTGSSENLKECGLSSVVTETPNEELYLNSFCFFLRLNNDNLLLPNFSKHLFRSEILRKKIIKTASGVTRFNVSKELMKKIQIPLPPLKKQAKIAAVLDKFTELTEELTAREAQYEYYRDMLLSKEYIDKKRSQFVKIKEICIKQKGINITAKEMKQLNKKNTPIKIFGGGNTSVTVDKKDINVDIISKPSIIVKSRGNIDFEFYDKPFTHKNELWSYSSKNNNVLNIKYLYYYLKNEIEYFKNKAIHGRMPQISNGITDDYSFYLPPIEIQNKIVNILDNFETLVNDIKQGLPREIELRQKQYEYYREKLLTFEEK